VLLIMEPIGIGIDFFAYGLIVYMSMRWAERLVNVGCRHFKEIHSTEIPLVVAEVSLED